MRKNRKFSMMLSVALLAFLFTVENSGASLIIDFRTNLWSSANRKSVYSVAYGDIMVTASAWKLKKNGRVKAAKLGWWNDSSGADGFGIYGGENDEIDRNEFLRINFDRSMEVSGFHLTDLFKTYSGQIDGTPFRGERANVVLMHAGKNTNLGNYFGVDRHTTRNKLNGNLRIQLSGQHRADSVTFLAPYGKNNEFSVAEVQVSPTPEPGTLLLLGSGLVGLAGIRKRKESAGKKKHSFGI